MPRSAPGFVTGSPSSSTRPLLARSRPATMRSSVDFPQPDGPRMVMKSLSATRSETGSSARVGGAPARAGGKTRATPSMTSLLMPPPAPAQTNPHRQPRPEPVEGRPRPPCRGSTSSPLGWSVLQRASPQAPGEQAAVGGLEQEIGHEADQADDDDAEDDLPGREQGLAVGDHVADAGGG